ncbi:MAG: hypothetical protein CME70_20960 [Halobacteriovorax sp.]|nr:hypothetical protein [Halobacteriovorax sp.]|tara:strand:+ start:46692 stop:47903 length:1212 start_codon:yes stop_codon:yes gene_type:complete
MLKASMNLTFAGLIVLSLGIFTSISIGAISHILLALGIIALIIHDPKNYLEELLSRKHLVYSLSAFILAIIVSVLFNWTEIERPLKNILKAKYFLIPLLSIPTLSLLFKDHFSNKKLKILLYLFAIATTVATLSGIIGLYTGYNPLKFKAACHENRACGLYGMYMTYGYGISLFMVLSMGSIIYIKRIKEFVSPLLLIPVWIINLAGLILSYARGGWLGFFFGIPFFALKKNPKKFCLSVLFILISLVGAIAISPTLQTKFLTSREGSNNQRIAFYKTAIKAFQEKPIIGWGYKNYEPNVKALKKKYNIAYAHFGADAHNIFLEVMASTGIIGLFCFLYFLIVWGYEAYSGFTLVHLLSFPFIVSICISGMVQNIFGDGENLFFIMLVWSLLGAAPKERRQIA